MLEILQWIMVACIYLYVMGVVAFARYLRGRGISPRLTRRLIHLLAGDGIMVIPLFTSVLYPLIICIGLGALTFYGLYRGLEAFRETMRDDLGDGLRVYGPFYYIVSIALLLLLFWNEKWVVIAGTLVMAWGDGMASMVASMVRRRHLIFGSKSVEGLLGMYSFSALGITAALLVSSLLEGVAYDLSWAACTVLAGAAVASIVELATQGPISAFDNFTVPLLTSTFLYLTF